MCIRDSRKGFYEKYGEEAIKKMGDAPWYIEILCNRIIYLMKNNRFEEALFNMGELGHYIGDIHQPLHVVLNYNGQKTGNDGVHFRWEVRLIDEYVRRIEPIGKTEKINDPISFANVVIDGTTKGTTTDIEGNYICLLYTSDAADE